MDMRLRPATDADENLLECIYRSTREEELSLTPWDETQRAAFVSMQFIAQRTHYGRYFARSTQWIFLAQNWKSEPSKSSQYACKLGTASPNKTTLLPPASPVAS